MTTPQNELYNLSYEVKRLRRLFEGKETDDNELEPSIFDKVDELHLGHKECLNRMDRIENQLSLIIKLLSKNE